MTLIIERGITLHERMSLRLLVARVALAPSRRIPTCLSYLTFRTYLTCRTYLTFRTYRTYRTCRTCRTYLTYLTYRTYRTYRVCRTYLIETAQHPRVRLSF